MSTPERLREVDVDIDLFVAKRSRKHQRADGKDALTPFQIREKQRCRRSCSYFINNYCKIYVATKDGLATDTSSIENLESGGVTGTWVPFRLWAGQERALYDILNHLLVIALKARQLGITWLALAFALWLMLFRPIATILLFSKRDDEAMYLLGQERLRGMYQQLPEWLKRDALEAKADGHVWTLTNGSTAKAFPTTGGDSYTATLAVVDEGDLIPNLEQLMRSVKPTIDAGGRMLLIGRVDKTKPQSLFKKIFRSAWANATSWKAIFLGWFERPERSEEWYAEQVRYSMENEGSLDYVYEQYPATPEQALAPRALDKRFNPNWLLACYRSSTPYTDLEKLEVACPAVPGLRLYVSPKPAGKYLLAADPAEGNPQSNDSSFHVLDEDSGEQMCVLSGKLEPRVFASYIHMIGMYFNCARVMVLRNNHGHALINELQNTSGLKLISGPDKKPGYAESSLRAKTILYDLAAEAFQSGDTLIHDFSTYNQLASIEANTLKAPEGEEGEDDEADAYAAALLARAMGPVLPTEIRSYLNDRSEDDDEYIPRPKH